MTDEKLLRRYIDRSGYKIRFIAEKLNISYQCFLNKLKNISEFKQSEIIALCELLNISAEDREKIFFKKIA